VSDKEKLSDKFTWGPGDLTIEYPPDLDTSTLWKPGDPKPLVVQIAEAQAEKEKAEE
jgi:hypothetical protein